jgi:uncharacterized protein
MMENDEMSHDNFRRLLAQIANARMPFGKYGPQAVPPHGAWIIDLPIEYLVWFKERGFPKGPLGELLSAVYDIKSNGMDVLFEPMRQQHGGRSKLRPQRRKVVDFTQDDED